MKIKENSRNSPCCTLAEYSIEHQAELIGCVVEFNATSDHLPYLQCTTNFLCLAMPLLRPIGEILHHVHRSVLDENFLCGVFWRISAPEFGACNDTIKVRFYANQMKGVKACLYDEVRTQGRGISRDMLLSYTLTPMA